MKNVFFTLVYFIALLILPSLLYSQQNRFQFQPVDMSNWRPYDQRGLNIFETVGDTTEVFTGLAMRLGAGFTQPFQSLKHSNNDSVALYPRLAPGFAVAQANLYMDVQLAQGIKLNLTTYLSSRHHNEAWVKGGYLQIDHFPFQGALWDMLSKYISLKVGHMEINYGDAHFRRSDGGHVMYNSFAENYIMDAFATEVAGEAYVHSGPFLGMIGVSNGLINGGHQDILKPGTTTNETLKRGPSIYGKLAYDKQFNDDIRGRIAVSAYQNGNDGRSTLYGGDRTGSNYYFVMESATATSKDNAFSGRYNPSFTRQITALQFNALVAAYGVELFATYENAKGRTINEVVANNPKRTANQLGLDLLYRFGSAKNIFIGGRYNTVKGKLLVANNNEQSIERIAVGAGWFITKQILLKGEYVNQKYKDFPSKNILADGEFKGIVIEAAIGF